MCPSSVWFSKKEVRPRINLSFRFSSVCFRSSKINLSFLSEAVRFSSSRSVMFTPGGLLQLGESFLEVGDLMVIFAEADMLDGARVVYVGTAKPET